MSGYLIAFILLTTNRPYWIFLKFGSIFFKIAMLFEANNIALILPKTTCPTKFWVRSYGLKSENRVLLKAHLEQKELSKIGVFQSLVLSLQKIQADFLYLHSFTPKIESANRNRERFQICFFPLDHKVVNGYCHHTCLSIIVVFLSVRGGCLVLIFPTVGFFLKLA